MKPNEGKVDRILRVVLGIALLSQAFFGMQTVWGYVGIVPLLTGIVGICPLYSVLGFNTCPAVKK
jgi:hypothetical protein